MITTPVHITSPDGWRVRTDVTGGASGSGPAALLVPASKHERDGYGPTLLNALVERGFTVMTTDIRGRGDSRLPHALHAFPPGQMRGVGADVTAALAALAAQPSVDARRLVVFSEQDTADAAAAAAASDDRVVGLVLISAKLGTDALDHIARRRLAVCGLTGKEEPVSLRAVIDAYCRSTDERSRLRVVGDVGSGTTMFSAWQFLHRHAPPLEHWLAAWAAFISQGGTR